mgnify:CR=1 FL=1
MTLGAGKIGTARAKFTGEVTWPHITREAFSMVGEALLRAHKYHIAKGCQEN